MPPPASLPVATKAKAQLPLRAAPWLAFIIAAVQLATAKQAALQSRLLGQIPIDFFQQLKYLLICQMVLAPAFSDSVFHHLRSGRKNPRRASSRRGFQITALGYSGKIREFTPSASPTAQNPPPARLDFAAKAEKHGTARQGIVNRSNTSIKLVATFTIGCEFNIFYLSG